MAYMTDTFLQQYFLNPLLSFDEHVSRLHNNIVRCPLKHFNSKLPGLAASQTQG